MKHEQTDMQIEISSEGEYRRALTLMDDLLDVYTKQRVLIEVLSRSIQRWEDDVFVLRSVN